MRGDCVFKLGEIIAQINTLVGDFLWSPVMLFIFVGIGVYFTVRTRFFSAIKIGYICKTTIGETIRKLFSKDPKDKPAPGSVTPFQALSSALAGTVGTGNIVGVATAIVTGGPGAIFWMWVSAFFGMMTKFAEVTLAVHYRERNAEGEWSGGPMYYISRGMGKKWNWLAKVFAVLGAVCTFGIGNMTQVNSISSSVNDTFGIPALGTGLFIALMVGLVIIGGIRRIASVTEKIVPLMCVTYLAGACFYLALNLAKIPAAFVTIVDSALNVKSVTGGMIGYSIANAMRFGIARGIFTNEAGMGSAPIVHATADTDSPVKQGFFGIFEVFGDTLVMCTITALVIITSGLWQNGETGAVLSASAFATVMGPKTAGFFISICISFFAFASCIGWFYYGAKCFEYLFGVKHVIIYKLVYCVVIVIGAVSKLELIWAIADTLNALMTIPNLIAVVALSPVVLKLFKDYVR